MKRIITILLLMMLTLTGFAQSSNLHISQFMSNNQKRKTEGTKELYVSGKKLKPYNLTFYHSFTLTDKSKYEALARKMEAAVKADSKTTLDREVVEICGHLYYAILTLPKKDDMNRYIFYKDTTLKGNGKEVIVVYMEGMASVEEIEKKFKLK